MKVSILINLFFMFCFNSYSQWSEQVIIRHPPKLNCVSANIYDGIGVYEGWVGGDSGKVIYTSDKGATWNYRGSTLFGSNNIMMILSVGNFPSGKAICSFNNAAAACIYLTNDKGVSWSQVYSQNGGRIRAASFINDSTGFVIGDPVGGRWTILKTTNRGSSFDSTGLYLPQNGSELGNYHSIYSATLPNVMIIGTNSSRVYYSTNNGLLWTQFAIPFANTFAVTLGRQYNNWTSQGYSNGYLAGEDGLYTTNYGQTWTGLTLPGTGVVHSFYRGLFSCYTKNSMIYSASVSSPTQFALDYTSPVGGNYTDMSIAWSSFEGTVYIVGWAVKDNGTVSSYYRMINSVQKNGTEVPHEFSLSQNYPNPFNPSTTIKFNIPVVGNGRDRSVRLTICDALGREITTLVNEQLQPGEYSVTWDATSYPSGVYFYKLRAGEYIQTKKMVLIK